MKLIEHGPWMASPPFGDVRDILVNLPRFAHDNPESVTADVGYEARLEIARDERALSVFEIGCQFGHGLITLLEACPNAEWVGWVDDESAFEGSNEAVHENLDAYVEATGRAFNRWHSKHVRDAMEHAPQVDVVMVDGDHHQHACLMDLTAALSMNPRLLLVDDFDADHDVVVAVNQFAKHYDLKYEIWHAGAGLAVFRLANQ